MKVINKEDIPDYGRLMESVAIVTFTESVKGLRDQNFADPKGYHEELGMAVGQVALDKVIELTKDMDRDKLLRILAELAISNSVSMMSDDETYNRRIQFLSSLKK